MLHLSRLSMGCDDEGREKLMATGLALCGSAVSTKPQAVPIDRVDCPSCLKKWKGDNNRNSKRYYIVQDES